MSGIQTPPASPGILSPLTINIFSRHKKLTVCMSNCRNIEVVVLYPAVASAPEKSPLLPNPTLSTGQETQRQDENQKSNIVSALELEFNMSAAKTAQAPDFAHISPTSSSHDTVIYPSQQESQGMFRFLNLPLELRLKVYALLLPPRSHTIATQIPNNGFFFNTSTIPLHFISFFYPFRTSPPTNPKPQNPKPNNI